MANETNVAPQDLSPVANLVGIQENMVGGFWVLYLIIFALSILVYKLGFAKKLPILKDALIYTMMAIGCLPLAFFGIGLPVAEGLVVAAAILIVYKIRLHQSKKQEQSG